GLVSRKQFPNGFFGKSVIEDLEWKKTFISRSKKHKRNIIPVFIGDADKSMEMSRMLLKEGVFVQGIRPPTVPQGKSRLRVTVTSSHSMDDINIALESFKRAGERLGII
ncbi:MAG: aminotransferase class I/II-fold pyridoxal phosphate-dependent enzyme, partial [Nitrospinota bacterium]